MANSNPTVTVSAQSGSLIEDVSSTASIQLSSSSSTDKLSFIESALIKAGWVKTGVVNSYISAGLYGKAELHDVHARACAMRVESLSVTALN